MGQGNQRQISNSESEKNTTSWAKGIPMVYSNQMISPENLHINNLVQTEMVVLIYLVKMFIYMNN